MFNWRDIFERLISTVVQAFLGALPAGFALTDISALKVAGLAGIAAGVAAVLSFAKNLIAQALEIGKGYLDVGNEAAYIAANKAREYLDEAIAKLS